MALRHLGLSQEMHWPVLTSNDSVWGERIALLFQEPAQCQPHFNHSEVLCCVAKTALKKKTKRSGKAGWQSLDQPRGGLGQEGAWERLSTGTVDPGGL